MKFKINPGELRHPIIIQRATNGKNEDNIPVTEWKDLINPRAKVLNVRGDEFYKAQGEGSNVEKTFYIRAPRSIEITRKDRVLYKSKIYNIVYTNDIEERGLYIELKCEVIE